MARRVTHKLGNHLEFRVYQQPPALYNYLRTDVSFLHLRGLTVPIDVTWDDDTHRVINWQMQPGFTWDEFGAAVDQSAVMMNTVSFSPKSSHPSSTATMGLM